METLVIIDSCETVTHDDYPNPDMEEITEYRLFTDYDKARIWALQWVSDYNKRFKKSKPDSTEWSDEPVLVEEIPNRWAYPLASVIIYQGEKIKTLHPEEIIMMP